MSVARYFQDELDYLRSSGEEFSRAFPKLTNYLSSRSTDPDVERLLEGFAFLTGRLREKIDDQLPEVTQSLLMLLWPNFLRPLPSMTILQFSPVPGAITERQEVPKGAQVDSVPVDGTVCHFRSGMALDVLPLGVGELRHDVSREASVVTLSLATLADEALATIGMKRLRFFLGGSTYSSMTLNLWLHRYLRRAVLRPLGGGAELDLGRERVRPVGMGREEGILPYPDNAFIGYRLLQEFFALPRKFCFVDVEIPTLSHLPPGARGCELVFEFERPLPPDVRIQDDSFQLHCVPAINLFEHDAEPILIDGRRVEYKVLPARRDASEIEVFSIDAVSGWTPSSDGRSGGIARHYERFESFVHEIERSEGRTAVYYREKVVQALDGGRLDRVVTFVREDESTANHRGETISLRLQCSNGAVAAGLAVDDIAVPAGGTPSFVRPRNILRPTTPCYPVVDGALQWQLISALSLNYLSLQDADALRTILHTFDYPSRVDRQREREAQRRLEGLERISSQTIDRLFRGLPVRGTRSTIEMRESKFSGEGEMYLFASVLAEFFALYSTINSFHELVVRGLGTGEEYRWTARVGNQPLI